MIMNVIKWYTRNNFLGQNLGYEHYSQTLSLARNHCYHIMAENVVQGVQMDVL